MTKKEFLSIHNQFYNAPSYSGSQKIFHNCFQGEKAVDVVKLHQHISSQLGEFNKHRKEASKLLKKSQEFRKSCFQNLFASCSFSLRS